MILKVMGILKLVVMVKWMVVLMEMMRLVVVLMEILAEMMDKSRDCDRLARQ